jgi:hypothetical protein
MPLFTATTFITVMTPFDVRCEQKLLDPLQEKHFCFVFPIWIRFFRCTDSLFQCHKQAADC